MSDGWVKIHRSLFDWEWWSDMAVRNLWLTILLSANHKPNKWQGMVIKAGQFVTSLQGLSDRSGLSVQSVRTALKKLQSTGEISVKSTNKNTLITVIKWADFQIVEENQQSINNQLTNNQQTINKQSTTNKNDKNEKNDKKVRNIFRKPTLEEVHSYISEKGLNVDAEYFYDYYESNGWTVGKNHMKSWQSTLNNWSRREKKKGAGHVVIEKPSYMGTGYDPDAFKW